MSVRKNEAEDFKRRFSHFWIIKDMLGLYLERYNDKLGYHSKTPNWGEKKYKCT